ncbi:hypothetical protein QTI24_07235 [Variovorax sp. J22P240]|uniref:hypothetical protein n=1 Tax=Variovorax sp. J22P240 TaxID=3053514 RepID=UPI002576E6E3|nr:hypothetical protein [Variovorax sp. J22P240]MDL9998385.1 hypothetical protein [Variovorax sp. J22P240]
MSTTAAQFPRALSQRTSLSRAGYAFIAVFLLVVLEGAVRKWVLLSATLPLILVRDLLAIYVIFYAWNIGALRRQKRITTVLLAWSCVVVAWGLLQLVAGESSPAVLLIGLRFWLLYIWFGVAAAAAMNEADYRAAMLVAVGTLLVMAPLSVVQHFSPPGARINAQLEGGDEEGVFVAVAGVVRTTGTFSFTLGYSTFIALVAPLVFALVGARKRTRLQFLFVVAAFGCFIIASVVSGSRTAVIYSGLMVATYFAGRLWLAKGKGKVRAAIAIFFGMILVALLLYAFSGAIEVTGQRFEQASEVEDFWERMLHIFIGEPYTYKMITWLGYGLGLGSNLATYVRTGDSTYFALAEVEASRILLEGGLIGYLFTALKLVVLAIGVGKSIRLAYKQRSVYPILLWMTVSLAILTWPAVGQISAHGLLGLMLAFGLLVFRYPKMEFFPPRSSSP